MSNRVKYLLAGFGVVAVAVGAVWWFVFRDDAPPPVSLDDAVASVTTLPGGTTTTGPDTATNSFDGTWTIDTSEDSFVGYRVQEELASIGAKTAVGRTPALTGTVEFAGTSAISVSIEADLTQLESDDSRRDRQMQGQALETNLFPSAVFTITQPIELGQIPNQDVAFSVEAIGEFTLHGVTRSVTIPMQGQLIGDSVVLVGGIEIVFSDYEIERPSAAIVLSVADVGEMEFQLFLIRA